MIISLSWTDFKDIVKAKQLYIQYNETAEKYTIWAIDNTIEYKTRIIKSGPEASGIIGAVNNDDQIDFENNYKSDANRPQVVARSSTTSYFIGRTIEISDSDSSGYCEWIFDKNVYISKVLPVPINAEFGDYIDFTIHLVSDDTQIGQYGDHVYLYGNSPNQWFYGSGGGKIPYGTKVRCTYYKAAGSTTAKKFIIIAEYLV